MFDFENLPIHWINRIAILARKELIARFGQAGFAVSPEEWAILMRLWHSDGQSPGDMSSHTVRDPTTMTRLIDGMVKKGLVERHVDPQDRRRSRIYLNPLGRDLQADLVPLARPLLERAMTGVSVDDQATVLRVLRQMNENLDAPWRPAKGDKT